MTIQRCPTCSNRFETEASLAVPFCSERCREMDLAAWLDERHGIPYEQDEEELDVEP